jgi:hypothetical protein
VKDIFSALCVLVCVEQLSQLFLARFASVKTPEQLGRLFYNKSFTKFFTALPLGAGLQLTQFARQGKMDVFRADDPWFHFRAVVCLQVFDTLLD